MTHSGPIKSTPKTSAATVMREMLSFCWCANLVGCKPGVDHTKFKERARPGMRPVQEEAELREKDRALRADVIYIMHSD